MMRNVENGNFIKVENQEGTFIMKKYKPKKSRTKRARNGSAVAKRRLDKRIQKQSKRIVAVKSDKTSARYSTMGAWESNEVMMLEHINKHVKSRMKYV
ncbi:hypothetical protein VR31_001491 [Escherichia coli]|nr:hypothetical protein [Escherichia coli]EGY0307777.1 hypothetical protein [Escherichia coli]EIY4343699.1 hypothetical protein [Escherichia coli]EMC6727591.1 hypothetical protein [Escherichia coli]